MALTSFWWTSGHVGQTNNNKTSTIMIPRIRKMSVLDDYILFVKFDDGYKVLYDVKDDIKTLPSFRALVDVYGLFKQAQLDKPNLCILERQDRSSQRQYLWVWKGCIITIPPSAICRNVLDGIVKCKSPTLVRCASGKRGGNCHRKGMYIFLKQQNFCE